MTLARLLAADERIAFVAYPGLESHPNTVLPQGNWADEVRRHDGLRVARRSGDTEPLRLHLTVITSAVSLGHDESLIVHVGTDGPRVAALPPGLPRIRPLRFSVGLEDADDLAADLRQALDKTFA